MFFQLKHLYLSIFGDNYMKSSILALATIVCSFNAMAATSAPQSIPQFCEDRASLKSVKELTNTWENLMAFENNGGLRNNGVCWWHSRMQRNALYLSIYKPGEPRPTTIEAQKIIKKLRAGKEVIVIPGFANFEEFSSFYRMSIQEELDNWQKSDGVAKFNWIIGLSGKSIVKAEVLSTMMDELYDYVENQGNIAYQKLQIKGIVAHAWLVVNMKKVEDGYDLKIIDSNYQDHTSIYEYRKGMTNFNHNFYGNFVPYLERTEEMNNIASTILKECDPEAYEIKMQKEFEEREKLRKERDEKMDDRK